MTGVRPATRTSAGRARPVPDPSGHTKAARPRQKGAGPAEGSEPGEEAGFAGGFEGLLFGLLLFVVGTLMVAGAWGVVDTKFAVDAAARQAVRTYVEAPDPAAAGQRASEVADATLAGYGRSPADATVTLVAGSFSRCSRVTIAVTAQAPLLTLPWLGTVRSGETVTAAHSELVDPFRSGLAGTSSCP